MTRISPLSALLCCLLLVGPAAASLENRVQHILSGASLGETATAVLLVDLHTGEAMVEIGADRPMVPASTMKLLTTAAALTRLGPDFKFSTRLHLVPPEVSTTNASTTVNGAATPDALPSLLIRGEGDPAFGDPVLLAQAGYDVDDPLGPAEPDDEVDVVLVAGRVGELDHAAQEMDGRRRPQAAEHAARLAVDRHRGGHRATKCARNLRTWLTW